MNQIALAIRDLSIGYQTPVASTLNMEIYEKEFVTIMGENGCGKTTLIDSLLGFTPPLNGKMLFWNQENRGAARAIINQKVGWVLSQKESYPMRLSVKEFIDLVAVQYLTWNWSLCERLYQQFDLDRSKKLSHLSMGEHSKVRLIKALSFEPKLIVLDELTANLSPTSKTSVLEALLDMFASRNMAVLYVCHSKDEAFKLSDRILKMESQGFTVLGGQNV